LTRGRAEALRIAGADGLTLAAEAYGAAEAPPILFLHGGGQSRSAWRGAAQAIAGEGYRTLTIDIRGHGESDWSPDGEYGFDRYVADLRAIIDWLGRPAILVGASLGGHIATVAAARLPKHIAALALADVTPWLDEENSDDIRAAMRRSALGFDTLAEAAASVNALRGAPDGSDGERLRRHMREGDDGLFYWRWDVRFLNDEFVRHGGEGGMFAAAVAALAVPVLLMHAEHSNIVDEAQVARFREVLPTLAYEKIPGVGHMVAGDDNAPYLPALRRFLGAIYRQPERPPSTTISAPDT